MLIDTHVAVWLHAGLTSQFAEGARALLESEQLRISPPSLLELDYLFEIGRTSGGSDAVLSHLVAAVGLQVAEVGATTLFRAASSLSWTRDPFDRLVAAHASISDEALLTRDELILEHLPQAVWPKS